MDNHPVTTGDRIWADDDARAEVEMGDAIVRVWQATEVDVVRLDEHNVQIAVPQGSAALRVAGYTAADELEIDAPNAAVSVQGSGEYRVDVSADGQTTTVKVWSGSAEVTSAGSSFALEAHQVATIHGDSTSSPTYDVAETTSADDFDQWSTDRDNRANRAMAERRYVPGDMPGVEDLDEDGEWGQDVDYGPVWYPAHVEADWVPYRFGHWAWIGIWGWTWIDDAQWGWAPFHYGRWARFNDRWGWCPGRVIAPAVYAPALVVFLGGGSWGASVSFGAGGGVGWFPLGPGEAYRPPYVVSAPYIRRLNVTTVTNITNITNITNVTNITYRNRGEANAVTVVSHEAFGNSTPVGHSFVRVPEGDLQRAPVLRTGPMVAPTRASVIYRAAGGTIVQPRGDVDRRTVVALHAAPPALPSVEAQWRAAAANGGRPPTYTQLETIPPTVRAFPVRSAARGTNGRQLVAARPGLPTTQPAMQSGAVARGIAAPPGREQAQPRPAQGVRAPESMPASAGNVTRGPSVGPPPPVPRPASRWASPSLSTDYAAQRQAQEARHVEEFARPSPSESPVALATRQQAEDRALENRFHQAAASGRATMPAPRESPAPRSSPPPEPRKR